MGYETRTADLMLERPVILGLWAGALRGQLSREDKLRMHYADCPWGQPLVEMLENDGVPVGVVAIQPRPMEQHQRSISAGLLMDFAVAPSHRSVGPALKLQRSILARGDARFDLVYGMPNDSARALSERAGMQPVGAMTRFVRVVNYGHYFEPHMPRMLASTLGRLVDAGLSILHRSRNLFGAGKAVTWMEEPCGEIDDLWKTSDTGSCVLAARDSRRLRWRFASDVARRVGYLLIRDRAKGQLEGWFACDMAHDALRVVDYWTRNATRGTHRALIDALAAAAAAIGCASVSIELLAPDVVLQSWLVAGFVARESRPVLCRWRRELFPHSTRPELMLTSADEDE